MRAGRLGLVVALAVAVTALAASLVAVSATAAYTSAPSAEVFASRVFSTAAIPPGATATATLRSTFLSYDAASVGPRKGLTDVHALYLVDESPDAVIDYVRSHPPAHGRVTGSEHVAVFTTMAIGTVVVTLPVSPPHEYLAMLDYDVARVRGGETELRVDSQTVWEPLRPAVELAPDRGVVVHVTGYEKIGNPRTNSRGPVTVTLAGKEAGTFVKALNSLPLGSGGCWEDPIDYTIQIVPKGKATPVFIARACGKGTLLVTVDGKTSAGNEPFPPLYDAGCSLFEAVKALLPRSAAGTRRLRCHSNVA